MMSDDTFTAIALSGAGAILSLALSSAGSAYATAKKAQWILSKSKPTITPTSQGTANDDKVLLVTEPIDPATEEIPWRAILSVAFAGIPVIYGLIVTVLILSSLSSPFLTIKNGYQNLCAGFMVGLCGLFSGYAMGHVVYPKNYTVLFLLDIFCKSIALYGFILAIIVRT